MQIDYPTPSQNSHSSEENYELGIAYKEGVNRPQDYNLAVIHLKKASESKHAGALYELGNIYLHGLGVKADHREAIDLYRKSANQGNPDAMCILAMIYEDAYGVSQNMKEAIRLYHMAMELNHHTATARLGWIFLTGQGVTINENLAFEKFQSASLLGDKESKIDDIDADLAYAIALGELEDSTLFTIENLSKSPKYAQKGKYHTFYHWIASEGLFDKLDPSLLTDSSLNQQDTKGQTPLHVAAETYNFHTLDLDLYSEEILNIRDKKNQTVLNIAENTYQYNNTLDDISSDDHYSEVSSPLDFYNQAWQLLTKKGPSRDESAAFSNFQKAHTMGYPGPQTQDIETLLVYKIALGHLSDSSLFSISNLSKIPKYSKNHVSFYHWIASEGLFHKLPSESLNERCLSIQDSEGRTPLHVAAYSNNIHTIPKTVPSHLLEIRDSKNLNVYDIAKKSSQLSKNTLPTQIETTQELIQKTEGVIPRLIKFIQRK